MGVKGLTTYINYKRDVFLRPYYLHDCCLIVDGHSLCALIYRSINCFSAFGGDYDKYAASVRNFFKSLRKCNITCYVLFDGSYEKRKLKTAFSRIRSRINGASKLNPVTQGSQQIFPLLLRDVFKEVLSDMDVPYTICEFEADDEIAAMARHLNCPVLSYDSDFFIYNVAYIPFNTLALKPQPIDINGEKVYALNCRIYKVEYLTEHFGGLKEELLPLLATLLGNDFVKKKVFNKFFSQLKLPKSKKKQTEQQRCIHGLFKWLQNETLDSAILKILGRFEKHKKYIVLAVLKKSIAGYNRKHCNSLRFFNLKSDPTTVDPTTVDLTTVDPTTVDPTTVDFITIDLTTVDPTFEIPDDNDDLSDTETDSHSESSEHSFSEENSVNENDNSLQIPDWYSEAVRHRRIPQIYLNLYTHHMHFCSPQAEDYSDTDSFLCALPILRFAFDLLTDFCDEDLLYVARENNSNYKRLVVAKDGMNRHLDVPFSEMTLDQLQSNFYNLIEHKLPNLDYTLLELLPSNFRLIMISILWWVKYCNVPLHDVLSIFICYIMLDVIDQKTGTFRGHYYFHNKYSKKLEELRTEPSKASSEDEQLYFNRNKVQYEDCLIAASVLLKHFEINDTIRKKPKSYDVKKVHVFAQFQCCIQQMNALNTLCGKPYENSKFYKSYNGSFVYNVSLKLENQKDPGMFIEQYLKGSNTILKFFRSLCLVYERFVTEMSIKNLKRPCKKRRRKGKIEKSINLSFNDFNNFEADVII